MEILRRSQNINFDPLVVIKFSVILRLPSYYVKIFLTTDTEEGGIN